MYGGTEIQKRNVMKHALNYPALCGVILLLFSGCSDPAPETSAANGPNGLETVRPDYALAIHGGAGTITSHGLTAEEKVMYQEALNAALDSGEHILKAGGTALDAVVACITLMEDHPGFNAGCGAVFTHEGKNELDASLMDGRDRNAGAVAGLTTVRHPILAARAVMEHSPHVLLSGAGAEQFAEEKGLERVDPSFFFTQKRYDALQKAIEQERGSGNTTSTPADWKYGTVGAVAMDREGNLAAGTSTGGMTNKRWNRIGDSPLIGAGTWADNTTCAVSCTGHGEFFIRNAVAYDLAARLEYRGDNIADAAHTLVMEELVQKRASGGLIAVDTNGNIVMPFNTAGMFRGMVRPGEREVGMGKNDEKK
jgi:beta-aspartyl-peptidase (threonine type)